MKAYVLQALIILASAAWAVRSAHDAGFGWELLLALAIVSLGMGIVVWFVVGVGSALHDELRK